jgi:hypothetical protein
MAVIMPKSKALKRDIPEIVDIIGLDSLATSSMDLILPKK